MLWWTSVDCYTRIWSTSNQRKGHFTETFKRDYIRLKCSIDYCLSMFSIWYIHFKGVNSTYGRYFAAGDTIRFYGKVLPFHTAYFWKKICSNFPLLLLLWPLENSWTSGSTRKQSNISNFRSLAKDCMKKPECISKGSFRHNLQNVYIRSLCTDLPEQIKVIYLTQIDSLIHGAPEQPVLYVDVYL